MISEYDIKDKDNQSHVDSHIHAQVSGCNQNTEHQADKIDDGNTNSKVVNPSGKDFEDNRNEKCILTRSSTSSLVEEGSSSNGGKQVGSTSVSEKCNPQKDGLDLECESYPELVIDEMDSTLTNASLYDDAQEDEKTKTNDDDLDKDKLIALLKKEVVNVHILMHLLRSKI